MKSKKYPLNQVAAIKKKRYDQAVSELKARKKALENEIKKLEELKQFRQKEQENVDQRLNNLREAMDEGSTSEKIKSKKASLEVGQEKLVGAKKQVDDQSEVRNKAEDDVKKATENLTRCQKDVEKLKIHEEEWTKEEKLAMKKKVADVQEEIGSASSARKIQNKRK